METMQTYIAYQGQMALLKSSRINSINGHSVTFVKQKTIETQHWDRNSKGRGNIFKCYEPYESVIQHNKPFRQTNTKM